MQTRLVYIAKFGTLLNYSAAVRIRKLNLCTRSQLRELCLEAVRVSSRSLERCRDAIFCVSPLRDNGQIQANGADVETQNVASLRRSD